jgi:lysine 2,3-aminomutase
MSLFNERQEQIARTIDPKASFSDWSNWKWQLDHSVKDIETFEKLTGIYFEKQEKLEIEKTIRKFPLSITPYYLSLVDTVNYQNDPIFKQAFPSPLELIIDDFDMEDPLHEDQDSPVPGITHRYPDRVLFLVSNACAIYCRHCTRKRKVGDKNFIPSRSLILKGIEYIKQTPRVRDVLVSGGDPFLLSDDYLDWVLTQLRKIPHLEIIRIGTRIPVALPFRVTDSLVNMLKRHHPIWINTHFNHPREITPSAVDSLKKLADAGFPLGNQSVLLAGINDCPIIIRKLCHVLVQNRVRPYYLYQCDFSEGLSHFRTPLGKGIEILENLIGHTSGFTVPTFVVDVPGGGGKIPLIPNYIVSWSPARVILRNYKGTFTCYKEPENYQPIHCENDCQKCGIDQKYNNPGQYPDEGIARLLSESDSAFAINPGEIIAMDHKREKENSKGKQ